jgi:hypothetical protein
MLDGFFIFLTEEDFPYTFIDIKNHNSAIIEGTLIVTTDLFLLTGSIINKTLLIINIDLPFKIKNFFALTGKYSQSLGSTVTFTHRLENIFNLRDFYNCLVNFKQETPKWLKETTDLIKKDPMRIYKKKRQR